MTKPSRAPVKLTQKYIESIKPPRSKTTERYWDNELKGFALSVSGAKKSKEWIVQRDIRIGGIRKTRLVKLGPASVLSAEDARNRARDVLAEFHRGVDPKAKSKIDQTLQQWLDVYCQKERLAKGTVRDYRDLVKNWLADWAELPLRSLTIDMVEQRQREIRRIIVARKEKSGTANEQTGMAQANRAIKVISLLWSYAGGRLAEWPSRNPCKVIDYYRVRPAKQAIPKNLLSAFVEAAHSELKHNLMARDYLLFLLWSGMRREETSLLKWKHVDFSARVIRVPRENTKTKEDLDLPMNDLLFAILLRVKEIGTHKKDWVFWSPKSASGRIIEPKGGHAKDSTQA